MRTQFHALLVTITLLAGASESPGAETPAILIDGASLEARLTAGELRILDSRSEREYRKVHIPGALRVDVGKWTALAHSEGGFENARAWSDEVGKLGIDGKTAVVVYGSSLTSTARVWWTLKYLGVKEVLVLDGGWQCTPGTSPRKLDPFNRYLEFVKLPDVVLSRQEPQLMSVERDPIHLGRSRCRITGL